MRTLSLHQQVRCCLAVAACTASFVESTALVSIMVTTCGFRHRQFRENWIRSITVRSRLRVIAGYSMCLYVYMYVRIYTCMFVCICTYVCMYAVYVCTYLQYVCAYFRKAIVEGV